MRRSARFGAVVILLSGVELMAAPALLEGESVRVAAGFRTAGPVLVTAGFLGSFAITHALRWLALPPASWLLAAPVFLPHPPVALANSVAAGVLVAGLLVAPIWDRQASARYGGGWRSLWQPHRSTRQDHGRESGRS